MDLNSMLIGGGLAWALFRQKPEAPTFIEAGVASVKDALETQDTSGKVVATTTAVPDSDEPPSAVNGFGAADYEPPYVLFRPLNGFGAAAPTAAETFLRPVLAPTTAAAISRPSALVDPLVTAGVPAATKPVTETTTGAGPRPAAAPSLFEMEIWGYPLPVIALGVGALGLAAYGLFVKGKGSKAMGSYGRRRSSRRVRRTKR